MGILDDASLVEHWNLNETSGTRFGYFGNYDLTESGGSVPQEPDGIVDQGVTFDGTGFLTCPALNSYSFFESGYTISLWWKKSGDSVTYETAWAGYTARETIRSRATSQLQGRFLGNSWSIFSGTHNGVWHHFCQVMQWSGSGSTYNMDFYYDAVSIDPTNASSATTSFNGFTFGANVQGAEKMLSGSIDHITFFNRGLNSSEVSELYNGGSPPTLGGGDSSTVKCISNKTYAIGEQ